ncbi:MAG TPA: hypothetical protein VGS23_08640, partial [Thermoplasmata archaeon]|nr:hypothetical protein [Thermoplasmata archaeon]
MAEADKVLLANGFTFVDPSLGVAGPSAIEILLTFWPTLRPLPAVAALVAACGQKESPRHRELFAAAEKGALPDLENYIRVGIGYGVQVRHAGGDLHAYAIGFAERLDLALAAEGEVYQYVAPLLGFEAPSGWRLTLSNNVAIREVVADEQGRLLGPKSILGRFIREASPFPPRKPVGWLLSLETHDKPRHNSGAALAFNSFSLVVNALRTFKQGQIGFPGIGPIHLPYGTVSSGSPNPWFPGFGVWSPFGPDYRIDGGELKEFESFMTCALPLLDPSRDHPLGLAAARVSEAQIRPFDRDRILDASTA